MIPWCMSAANSAAATATREIATPKPHTHTWTEKMGITLGGKSCAVYKTVQENIWTILNGLWKKIRNTSQRSRCADALLHRVEGNKWFLVNHEVKMLCWGGKSTTKGLLVWVNRMLISLKSHDPTEEMCICRGDGAPHACSQFPNGRFNTVTPDKFEKCPSFSNSFTSHINGARFKYTQGKKIEGNPSLNVSNQTYHYIIYLMS